MQAYHIHKGLESSGRSYLNNIYLALTLFSGTIVLGVFGYSYLEGYNIIEAIYMTVITISTVGFTEVKPLSDNGRIFTSILILTNIGIFAYFISVMTTMMAEGELKNVIETYKFQSKIKKLKGHTIVCGMGRLGRQVAEELNADKKDFIAIESDPEILEHLGDWSAKGIVIEGDATLEDLLESVQIQSAEALITTLPKDSDNVFVVLSARQLNSKLNIISRASTESSIIKIKRAGANHVIMPEQLGGTHMAKLVTKPNLVEFLAEISSHEGVDIYFEECEVEKLADSYQNKTIREIDVKKRTGANIIGLRKPDGNFVINPSANELIVPGSKLIIIGDQSQISLFKKMLISQ